MVPGKGVRYREVSAIKHVHYREVPLYDLMIVNLYKKHCNGYTYISSTAGNFIMYKNLEIKIEKPDKQKSNECK